MRRPDTVVAVKMMAGMSARGSLKLDGQFFGPSMLTHDTTLLFLSSSLPVQGHRIVDCANKQCVLIVGLGAEFRRPFSGHPGP